MEQVRTPPKQGVKQDFLGNWHDSVLAWLILGLSIAVSIVAWKISSDAIYQNANLRFNAQAADIKKAISIRMDHQQVALRGGVGLLNASEHVSRQEWNSYYQSLSVDENLPGLQGFGFANFLTSDELGSYIAKTRLEGFYNFEVRPAGTREHYAAITYLEPFDRRNRRAFGYDMWSETTRRTAMQRAIDTGAASVSGMVTLVQEDGTDVQRGFLMYVPYYESGAPISTVEERRKSIKGFVYSPFRINDLMRGVLGNSHRAINFKIYDGETVEASKLLYDSEDPASKASKNPSLKAVHRVEIHGHPWLISFSASPDFISLSEFTQPYAVGLGALVIDLLLFFTIWTISRQRRLLNELVARRTDELHLAKVRAERSAEQEILMRKRAQQVSQSLQDSNLELTRFASIIAHDLRAPLKRIECFVDVLNEDFDEQLSIEGRDVAERIKKNSSRMRSMLDSLHEYTKVGNSRIKKERINLREIVAETVTTFRDIGYSEDMKCLVPDDLEILGDHNLIQNVLQNLIGNSIKFRGEKPLSITISGHRTADGTIELSIEDNGIGIEPQFAAKVFEMFTRLQNEELFEGSGIGLAVCRKIVRDHGGEISVCTDKRDGTLILMKFPELEKERPRSAA